MARELLRENLDRLAISCGGRVAIGCTDHPDDGTTAIYQDGVLRVGCATCGFEAARVKVASKGGSDDLASKVRAEVGRLRKVQKDCNEAAEFMDPGCQQDKALIQAQEAEDVADRLEALLSTPQPADQQEGEQRGR